MFGIINLVLLVAMILLGIGIFAKFKKKDAELLKAKFFLGDTLGNMWMYSSIVGVFFVMHSGLKVLDQFFKMDVGIFLDISWTLFFLSFIFLTYQWYQLISSSVK